MNRRRFIAASAAGAALTGAQMDALAAQTARRADPLPMPTLPYEATALQPVISARTVDFHFGKHHIGYAKKLGEAIKGTAHEGRTLEEIVKQSAGKEPGIFNLSAQIWNHDFYWMSMRAKGGGEPSGAVKEAIDAAFGDFAAFKKSFVQKASSLFGSGWTWLVKTEGGLAIRQTENAATPLTDPNDTPLLVLDVWEHAYYLDYQNLRGAYVEAWIDQLVNWDFAAKNLG